MQDYEKLGVFYLGREIDSTTGAHKEAPLLYDSRDLTTHAVCLGMTGSGKTGLCVALLEEAAIDGIPALCIDPKGDLANLALAFPNLAAGDFLPWMDPAEAQRQNLSVDQLAVKTAQAWKEGLAQWQQTPERIGRFKNAAEVAIYTPGSESGLPLSVLRSFAAPEAAALHDTPALRERISALVSGLLGLLRRQIDPLQSREHILLATVFEQAWREGRSLDLATLINAVQKPAFDKVGAFDLETFYPAKERLELAMALNNLLASPGFAAWMTGEPLDVQRLLFTPQGKPRIAIISIAHLSDAERMFAVTLVLNEVIAWMRRQSGTSSLRAILYMDEIFGYFPPTANPPSKQPMLTLLKQARAFGLGCVLATQNPVDLDYKGLSNAGTWFIGRLQTERDKQRLLDGLESALSGAGSYERSTLEKLISSLAQRVFILRNVHEEATVTFMSRWALSYLRGPLTGLEIARVMAQQKSEVRRGVNAPAVTQPATSSTVFPRPAVPGGVREYFLSANAASGSITYRPVIAGFAKLHFVDAKLKCDAWQTQVLLAPLSEDGERVRWNEAQVHTENLRSRLGTMPVEDASFTPLPAPALREAKYKEWSKQLAAHLYEQARSSVWVSDSVQLHSTPGESEGDFRARLSLAAREKRDAALEDLRRKYAPKFATLEDRQRRAQERIEREESQLSQQKMHTALSVGASVLGALLGRRKVSVGTVGRARTAARNAGRIGREREDVDRAGENLEAARQRREELQQQLDADIAKLEQSYDSARLPLREVQVSPRKADITVDEVALVWLP